MSEVARRVVVLGATGDVGRGVVEACLARGCDVTAVARSSDGLAQLNALHPGLRTATGSVADDDAAAELAGKLDVTPQTAVVVAVSLPWAPRAVLDTEYSEASRYWQSYLGAHLAAAKAFLPALGAGGLFVGVGGGMADFAAAGSAVISMSQAAQRMLYRTLALEVGDTGPAVRELMVVSKVHGHSNRSSAGTGWLTDAQIGERLADIIEDPDAERNRGPIIKILPERREQQ